jgi:hypothetical protein
MNKCAVLVLIAVNIFFAAASVKDANSGSFGRGILPAETTRSFEKRKIIRVLNVSKDEKIVVSFKDIFCLNFCKKLGQLSLAHRFNVHLRGRSSSGDRIDSEILEVSIGWRLLNPNCCFKIKVSDNCGTFPAISENVQNGDWIAGNWNPAVKADVVHAYEGSFALDDCAGLQSSEANENPREDSNPACEPSYSIGLIKQPPALLIRWGGIVCALACLMISFATMFARHPTRSLNIIGTATFIFAPLLFIGGFILSWMF